MTEAPRTWEAEETLPASTILATTTQQIEHAEEAGLLASASYSPSAAITGAASPASRTLTIVNKGQAGAGAVVMATLAFLGGINGAAFAESAFTLSVVAGALTVAAGDEIVVTSAPVGGTGLVDPGGEVRLTFSRDTTTTH